MADRIDEQVLSIIWQEDRCASMQSWDADMRTIEPMPPRRATPRIGAAPCEEPAEHSYKRRLAFTGAPPPRKASREIAMQLHERYLCRRRKLSNHVSGPDRQRPSSRIDATTTCATATDGADQDILSRRTPLSYLTPPEKPHLYASRALETTRPSAMLCSKSTKNQSRKTSPWGIWAYPISSIISPRKTSPLQERDKIS